MISRLHAVISTIPSYAELRVFSVALVLLRCFCNENIPSRKNIFQLEDLLKIKSSFEATWYTHGIESQSPNHKTNQFEETTCI